MVFAIHQATHRHIAHDVDGCAAAIEKPVHVIKIAMYSVGKPTEENTSVIVTNPASGIPAAPTEAKIEVSTTINCWGNDNCTPINWDTNNAAIAS